MGTIITEITRLQDAKDSLKASIIEKGGNVTNQRLDEYADVITGLEGTGGGGEESPKVIISTKDNKYVQQVEVIAESSQSRQLEISYKLDNTVVGEQVIGTGIQVGGAFDDAVVRTGLTTLLSYRPYFVSRDNLLTETHIYLLNAATRRVIMKYKISDYSFVGEIEVSAITAGLYHAKKYGILYFSFGTTGLRAVDEDTFTIIREGDYTYSPTEKILAHWFDDDHIYSLTSTRIYKTRHGVNFLDSDSFELCQLHGLTLSNFTNTYFTGNDTYLYWTLHNVTPNHFYSCLKSTLSGFQTSPLLPSSSRLGLVCSNNYVFVSLGSSSFRVRRHNASTLEYIDESDSFTSITDASGQLDDMGAYFLLNHVIANTLVPPRIYDKETFSWIGNTYSQHNANTERCNSYNSKYALIVGSTNVGIYLLELDTLLPKISGLPAGYDPQCIPLVITSGTGSYYHSQETDDTYTNRGVVFNKKDNTIAKIYGPAAVSRHRVEDDTYYYTAINTMVVKSFKEAPNTYVGITNYGGVIQSIASDDEHVYVGGATSLRIKKYLKTTLALVATSVDTFGVELSGMVVYNAKVYYVTRNGTGSYDSQTVRIASDSLVTIGILGSRQYGVTTNMIVRNNILFISGGKAISTYNLDTDTLIGGLDTTSSTNFPSNFIFKITDTHLFGYEVERAFNFRMNNNNGVLSAYTYGPRNSVGESWFDVNNNGGRIHGPNITMSNSSKTSHIPVCQIPYRGVILADTNNVYIMSPTIIYKLTKNLELITSLETGLSGGVVHCKQDATYLYIAFSTATRTIRRYLKADLSYIDQTPDYGGTINGIAEDALYVYAGGATTLTIRKYLKEDMSYVGQTPSYAGTILDVAVSNSFVACTGLTTRTLRRYNKDTLAYISQSAAFGTDVYDLSYLDNIVMYIRPSSGVGNIVFYNMESNTETLAPIVPAPAHSTYGPVCLGKELAFARTLSVSYYAFNMSFVIPTNALTRPVPIRLQDMPLVRGQIFIDDDEGCIYYDTQLAPLGTAKSYFRVPELKYQVIERKK